MILWKEKNDFKQKKIQVFKRAKKWTFSKGVSPWILSKNRTFSYSCYSRKFCQKKSFLNILNKKQSFLDQKKWSFNNDQKRDFFLKGLVHGFCPNIELFLICLFYRNYKRKKLFWYCGKKRMILSGKNLSFKRGKNMDISQRR